MYPYTCHTTCTDWPTHGRRTRILITPHVQTDQHLGRQCTRRHVCVAGKRREGGGGMGDGVRGVGGGGRAKSVGGF